MSESKIEVQARISSFRFSEGRLLAKVQFSCPCLKAPHHLLETREIDVTGVYPDEIHEKLFEHIDGYTQNTALVERLRFLVDEGVPFKLPADPLDDASQVGAIQDDTSQLDLTDETGEEGEHGSDAEAS